VGYQPFATQGSEVAGQPWAFPLDSLVEVDRVLGPSLRTVGTTLIL
jgi:hypothetical protein